MVSILKKELILFITLVIIFLPFITYSAGLVPCGGQNEKECTVCDLLVLVQNVIEFVIRGAFILCIVLIIYGGFRWLLSLGDPKNISAAQKIIVNALFGLLIVLAAWLIVHTIFYFLSPKIEGVDTLKSTWFKLECYPSESSGSSGEGWPIIPLSPKVK